MTIIESILLIALAITLVWGLWSGQIFDGGIPHNNKT